jgi:hypothetical protein
MGEYQIRAFDMRDKSGGAACQHASASQTQAILNPPFIA